MKTTLRQLFEAFRETLFITFVRPVRRGRPRPKQWPHGLAAITAGALVVYILLGLAAIFAAGLRQASPPVVSPATQTSLPDAIIPLLMGGLVLSVSLAHTAALHTTWWARAILFMVGGVALLFFQAAAMIQTPLLTLFAFAVYAGLLVFTIVRARRQFVWWEFLVVTTMVSVAMLSPWLFSTPAWDLRVQAIEATLTTFMMLSAPALIVAGSAPAEITVIAANAATRRPVGRGLFWVLGAAALVWLVVVTAMDSSGGSESLSVSAAGSAILTLAGALGVFALMLRRAGGKPPGNPVEYPEAWEPWFYPVAGAMIALSVVIMPLTMTSTVGHIAGLNGLADVAQALQRVLGNTRSAVIWRAVVGAGLLFLAWRVSKHGRTDIAVVAGSLSVLTILNAFRYVPGLGFLAETNPQMTGLVAAGAAIVIGIVLAVRRQLDHNRAAWLVAVILLAVLYNYRNAFDDPSSVAFASNPQIIVLFGLTWRILTDGEFLEGDNKAFPRPTRVLLFAANSLFAATAVAFVALARAMATYTDTGVWSNLGDWLLGEPMYTAALMAGLWLAVRPASRAAAPLGAPGGRTGWGTLLP